MAQQTLKTSFATSPISNAENFTGEIRKYISQNDCPSMTLDIRKTNLMDACKIATLCSTYHYIKYPQGKIRWIVSDDAVKQFVKPLSLGNIEICTINE